MFSAPARIELGLHVIFSPLPPTALNTVRAQLGAVNNDLVRIFDRTYAHVLLEMNGGNFSYPHAFLYGWPAPREVNIDDVGYYPFDLCWANFSERAFAVPADELVIGGTWDPDTIITADIGGVFRLRSKPSAEVSHVFHSEEVLFDYLATFRGNGVEGGTDK